MGKLDVYECDRCGKEFKLDEGTLPFTITFHDNNDESADDDNENIVCEDCYYIMSDAMGECFKEVDKTIEEWFNKKYPK